MSNRDVIICSFYTPDEYYSAHAKALGDQLSKLGIAHELLKLEKRPGEDWADTTRRKLGFIWSICQKHPTKKVFWIDVDCRISHLPDYISNTTADFIGFQRSFGHPLFIGYHNRTRFWEPSFWGVNSTEQGRKLVQDAYALEQKSTIKATDDYFLEEAWRANARKLTFQMIPTTGIVQKDKLYEPGQHDAFFFFGSSGNVDKFKGKVVQHGSGNKPVGLRKRLLKQAKAFEAALPENLQKPLRQIADAAGVTGVLTAGETKGIDAVRSKLLGEIIDAAQIGDRTTYESALATFHNRYLPSYAEQAQFQVSETLIDYADRGSNQTIKVAWWAKPFPGNFGDWLSPLLIASQTGANIRFQAPQTIATKKHIVALGSIGRFIKSNSVVIGTGISQEEIKLSPKAKYISVRGPITAKVLKASGGPEITAFGDPGVAISKVIPAKRGRTNGKVAMVRHFSHAPFPVQLPKNFEELSVLMSRPEDVKKFVKKLVQFDAVVTSAMHVMITCQSYGIPCALVTFEGHEENVHGTGIKYEDYALGAGVEVMNPAVVPTDLRKFKYQNLIRDIKVSEAKKKEVLGHIQLALKEFES